MARLIEAPGMPGGPTIIFKDLGELWREAKGLESLGVAMRGCPSACPGAAGTPATASLAQGVLAM